MIQPSDMRSENILKEHEKKQGKIQLQINITRSEFQRSFKNHYGIRNSLGVCIIIMN